jgi:hypothetical protein
MTHVQQKWLALVGTLALGALASVLASGPSDARGKSRRVYIQEYNFKQPMDGLEGHEGGGFCSYQRIPIRKCNPAGQCKVVGWTLR